MRKGESDVSNGTFAVHQARGSYKPTQSTIVLAVTLVLFAALGLMLPGFVSLGNLFTLARNISILGILALGMAVVVIGRGIDLSQIATLACSAAIAITLVNDGWSAFAAIGLGLLLSIAIGAANGLLISVIEIPALFTTLASGLLVLGLTRALVVPHYQVFLQPGHDWLLKLGGTVAGGLPVPVIAFAICAVIVHLFLSRTVLGRFIYAHGDNAQAARLSGMATRPLTMLEYAICSAIGYVGGVIMVGSTSLMHLQIAEFHLDLRRHSCRGARRRQPGRRPRERRQCHRRHAADRRAPQCHDDHESRHSNAGYDQGCGLAAGDQPRQLCASARRGDGQTG